MAAPKKENKKVEKKPASKKGSCYEISGESLTRKNKQCPKCGPGIFMASHKDRNTCGKCGYMEKKAAN